VFDVIEDKRRKMVMVSECFYPRGAINFTPKKAYDGKWQQFDERNE